MSKQGPGSVRTPFIRGFTVLVLVAVVLLLVGCSGDGSRGSSGAAPTDAGAANSPTRTPATATATASVATATVTPTPQARLEYEVDAPTSNPWNTASGVDVNFFAEVRNTGGVPIEIVSIRRDIENFGGVTLDIGILEIAFPQRIAPGANGVIGATLHGVSLGDREELAAVNILVEIVEASAASPLLAASGIEIRGAAESGQLVVSGTVENSSTETYGDVRIAVVLLDSAGRWIGFAPAAIEGDSIAAGKSAAFVTDADLPPGISANVASVLVFAFAE